MEKSSFDSNKKGFHIQLNIWNLANLLNQVCRVPFWDRNNKWVSSDHQLGSSQKYPEKAGLGLANVCVRWISDVCHGRTRSWCNLCAISAVREKGKY